MPAHDLTGKVALITGLGSSPTSASDEWPNGLTIAMLLARHGATIFGSDISSSAAAASAARILADSPSHNVSVVEADATSAAQCKSVVDACIAKHGRIDILVNNVGKSEPGGPAELTEEVWDAQLDVNLKSVYLMCHLVLPIMEAQMAAAAVAGPWTDEDGRIMHASGGVIINISSVAGLRYIGKPQVAYAAAKAAIIHFTKTTAVLYASKGVRLNTVVPGLIHTPLVKVLADKYYDGDYEAACRTRHAQVPMKRMGDAWDVAHAVLFLASDEAAYITGTEIVVDGGITCSTGAA